MTIEYTEQLESRRCARTENGITVTRVFDVAHGDPEEALIQAPVAVGDPHPVFYPPIYVSEITCEPMGKRCRLTVKYEPEDSEWTEHGERWEWDLAAQQSHITSVSSPSKQSHYPATHDAGVAIGVDGENVNGVDVYRPSLSLKVAKKYANANLDSARAMVRTMLNTVNHAWWHGYERGEVLYVGASVRRAQSTETPWVLEHSFMVAKRQENVEFELLNGATVGPLNIAPWDYVWFRHAKRIHTDGDVKIVKRGIESIHVAQVYEYTNFGNFNFWGPVS